MKIPNSKMQDGACSRPVGLATLEAGSRDAYNLLERVFQAAAQPLAGRKVRTGPGAVVDNVHRG